jgi:hypothetical protein
VHNVSKIEFPSDNSSPQRQTTEYISEMLLSMRGLALKHDLSALAFLLQLAHREANFRASDGR